MLPIGDGGRHVQPMRRPIDLITVVSKPVLENTKRQLACHHQHCWLPGLRFLNLD